MSQRYFWSDCIGGIARRHAGVLLQRGMTHRAPMVKLCGNCRQIAFYSSCQNRQQQSDEPDVDSASPTVFESKLNPVSFYMERAIEFQAQHNIPRAFRYYMQASVLGDAEATYQVAQFYLNYFKEETGIQDDFSVKQNFVKMNVNGEEKMYFVDSKTLRKMRMEADKEKTSTDEQEDKEDREVISEKILNTPLKESKKMAMTYFKKAATASPPHVPSMIIYGKYLIFDASRDQDFTKGIEMLSRAAEEFSSPEAYFLLGQLYYDGATLGIKARRLEQQRALTVEKDLPKAMNFFRKAAQLNNASALYFLGYSRYWGENGERQDKEEARALLKRAADLDHPEANYFLAMMFLEENQMDAYKAYLNRAVALKSPNALFARADQLMRSGDLDRALPFYEEAGNLGSTDASFCSGAIHYRKKNYVEAYEWYSKAAKEGSIPAVEAMLDMVKKGTGVSKDEKYAQHLEEYLKQLKNGNSAQL